MELERIEEKTPGERAELSAMRLALLTIRDETFEEAITELSREMYGLVNPETIDEALADSAMAIGAANAAIAAVNGFEARLRALENERGIK
jgi:hypothetical protein